MISYYNNNNNYSGELYTARRLVRLIIAITSRTGSAARRKQYAYIVTITILITRAHLTALWVPTPHNTYLLRILLLPLRYHAVIPSALRTYTHDHDNCTAAVNIIICNIITDIYIVYYIILWSINGFYYVQVYRHYGRHESWRTRGRGSRWTGSMMLYRRGRWMWWLRRRRSVGRVTIYLRRRSTTALHIGSQ